MSYFIYSLNAHKLGRTLKNYKDVQDSNFEEKHKLHSTHKRHPSLFYRLWNYCGKAFLKPFAVCSSLCEKLRNVVFPADGRLCLLYHKLRKEGTLEHYLFKSVIGYVGGILLTYVFFFIFTMQLKFTVGSSTAWCSMIGIILTLGLAFSSRVRCFVLLLLPLIFSKRGRQGLMAYALVLTLHGPGQNIATNIRILSESLACGQEQVKEALRQILDVIKKPLMAIKDAFHKVVDMVKAIAEKVKIALIVIKKIILTIANVIKTVYQWLKSIVNLCNKKLGTPYERCVRVLDDAVTDCQATLGPLFSWVCSIAYIGHLLCFVAKILDFICIIAHFLKTTVFVFIKQKILLFTRFIKNIFYVKVKYEREFEMHVTPSKSFREIGAGMVKDVQNYIAGCMFFFGFISLLSSLMFLNVLVKVWFYQLKYLTVDHFDNKYINDYFVDLDIRRSAKNMETVLPLARRERHHYVTTKSIRLVTAERVKVVKTGIFLALTTLKLSSFLLIDHALYWLIGLVRKYGKFKSSVKGPNMVEVNVVGVGMFASLLKSIVKAFKPLGIRLNIDTTECLPNGVPPDTTRIIQIVCVLALAWLVMFLEPYGMRLRHVVMATYHPDREKQRIVWLYNHILHSRSNLVKVIRRQLRTKFVKGPAGVDETSLKDKLLASFPWLQYILGVKVPDACMLCAHIVRDGDDERLIRCHKPSCPGKYCASCFRDMENLCTLCMEPLDYGDISDISLERDSSDEEVEIYERKKQICKEDIEAAVCSLEESDSESSTTVSSDLSYEYQDLYDTEHIDIDSDALIHDVRISVSEAGICVAPVPSSVEMFDEVLPCDYELRRRRTLSMLSVHSEDESLSSISVSSYSYEDPKTSAPRKILISFWNFFNKTMFRKKKPLEKHVDSESEEHVSVVVKSRQHTSLSDIYDLDDALPDGNEQIVDRTTQVQEIVSEELLIADKEFFNIIGKDNVSESVPVNEYVPLKDLHFSEHKTHFSDSEHKECYARNSLKKEYMPVKRLHVSEENMSDSLSDHSQHVLRKEIDYTPSRMLQLPKTVLFQSESKEAGPVAMEGCECSRLEKLDLSEHASSTGEYASESSEIKDTSSDEV